MTVFEAGGLVETGAKTGFKAIAVIPPD